MFYDLGWYGGGAGSVAAPQLQVPRFNPELGVLSLWIFACSLYVYVGFLQLVWFPPKKMHVGELVMINCPEVTGSATHTTNTDNDFYNKL